MQLNLGPLQPMILWSPSRTVRCKWFQADIENYNYNLFAPMASYTNTIISMSLRASLHPTPTKYIVNEVNFHLRLHLQQNWFSFRFLRVHRQLAQICLPPNHLFLAFERKLSGICFRAESRLNETDGYWYGSYMGDESIWHVGQYVCYVLKLYIFQPSEISIQASSPAQ